MAEEHSKQETFSKINNQKILFILISTVIIISYLSVGVIASSYNIEINQFGDKLLVKHIVSLESERNIQLNIPSDASSLESNLDYSKEGNLINITGKYIEVSYITSEALQGSRNGFYYVDNIHFNFDIQRSTIKFILDTGYFLEKDKIYPVPSKIETNGQQISLTWDLNNVKMGDEVPIFLTIETPSSTNYLSWMASFIILLIIIYLIYAIYSRKLKKSNEIERYLMESEKLIITELKKADHGELWQKQLQLLTNFSKAKLSRLIRNLEQRGLIEKIPFGNTNKVRIK